MDTPKVPTEQDDETIKTQGDTVVSPTPTDQSTSDDTDRQETPQLTVNDERSLPQEAITPPVVPAGTPAVPLPADPTMHNSPMTLVLQWLTYAFWGWFALAVFWLSIVTITYFVSGVGDADWSTVIAYPVAATIVLLLVAAAVDFFYARVEPVRKHGVATAIMVIHAVLFALCGIGAVIGLVFSLVNMSLSVGSSTSTEVAQISLLVSLVTLFVYAVLLARTLLVAKVKHLPVVASGVLAAIALLFIVLGVTGPVASALLTRNDRQLEAALNQVPGLVRDYTRTNNTLPSSLADISSDATLMVDNDTKAMLDKGVIRYTPNTKPASDEGTVTSLGSGGISLDEYKRDFNDSSKTYYYKLCVTWDAEKKVNNRTIPYQTDTLDEGQYASSVNTYAHKKGEQCYDLQAVVYGTN